ncbi:MAG: DUF2490 domain-containing protein [Bacteroidetes bacterium]|nr:DUF2490 domain-containing protein [Bacteroidota bacterium]
MKRILLPILLSFLFVTNSIAQTEDFGSWMTFSFNKKIVKNFDFNFDQELRLKNNLQSVNLTYTNIGVTYKFNKYFRISPVYRFIDKNKGNDSWGIRQRAYVDLIFKYKLGKFSFGYRARLQSEWRSWGYASDLGNVPELYERNMFKVAYAATASLSPYVASELRFQYRNPRIPYHNGFDRSRFYAGLNYDFNQFSSGGIYFMCQKEWNVNDRQTLYILGFEYSISLD